MSPKPKRSTPVLSFRPLVPPATPAATDDDRDFKLDVVKEAMTLLTPFLLAYVEARVAERKAKGGA